MLKAGPARATIVYMYILLFYGCRYIRFFELIKTHGRDVVQVQEFQEKIMRRLDRISQLAKLDIGEHTLADKKGCINEPMTRVIPEENYS